MDLDYLFVINRSSGRKSSITSWENFIADHIPISATHEILYLSKEIDISKLKIIIIEKNAKTVVAIGGDGTVALVANCILRSTTVLGIIPQGSANGTAAEMGISTDPEKAFEILISGRKEVYDMIEIENYTNAIHMADLGLNAHLIKYFEHGKQRGMMGYALVVLKTLFRRKKGRFEVITESVHLQTKAYMIVLANASKYGTGAVINPVGKLHDGKFEVVIVKKINFWALTKMLFKPGLFNPKIIEIMSVNSVEIQVDKPIHFQIDGEFLGKIRSLKAKVAADAIMVIVPQFNTQ